MHPELNKLSQFFQELKRRKVVRVITVYAAASFVILEFVSIIVDPLKLPEWTLTLVIVLLCSGFIIACLLAWIYDVTPEGIERTKPTQKPERVDKPVVSNGWKIATYFSFVVIVALIVLNTLPGTSRAREAAVLEKSVAVLPFINDSPDEENTYFVNGIMEEILLNLQAIKEFQVPGRTSVEQYRNLAKSVSEIARELEVNYIIEGSGQRYGNTVRLRIQLLEGAKGRHLWGESYEQEIESPEDIFRIQSQIAKTIAQELKAIITPQEKEVIERTLTSSLSAYDFFLRGREEHISFRLDQNNTGALERAEQLYRSALEYDSSYAQAYSGLAMAYWDKHYWETFFSKDFLDSVLIYADLALSHDDKLAEAYSLKGDYYGEYGNFEHALQQYETAISINPNYWQAYAGASRIHSLYSKDFVNSLDNLHMAVKLNHDQELPSLLRSLGLRYSAAGFPDKAQHYFEEAFKLDGDSISQLVGLANFEIFIRGDYTKAIEFAEQSFKIDSNNVEMLAWAYLLDHQYEMALEFYQKLLKRSKSLNSLSINRMQRIAYCYWKTGDQENADYFFDLQKKYSEESIKFDRWYALSGMAYYDLAGIKSFRNEKEKALENLRLYKKVTGAQANFAMLWYFRHDPLLDNIRDMPEFQQLLSDMEAKLQEEHERVRQWLEENDR